MSLVNIPRSKDDPNYRYKMPKLICRVEGRGNGIKTNISNMGDIAHSLKRPPMYPTKFFGCELGTQVQFSDAEEKAIVNGNHPESLLDEILDKFVSMYVLCPGCSLPETDICVKKKLLTYKCNACGRTGELDNGHKVATYMIKNPPSSNSSTMGSKAKDERKLLKDKSKTLKTEETEKIKIKKRSDDSSRERVNNENINKKKPKDKPKEKKNKHPTVEILSDEELTCRSQEIGDVITRLSAFMNNTQDITPDAFFDEIRILQVSQNFNAKCRIYVVFKTLFPKPPNPEIFRDKIPFIARCVDTSISTRSFLEGFESFLNELDPVDIRPYPMYLNELYQQEILPASAIQRYFQKSYGIPKLKDIAAPFITWLSQNSDSESESGLDQSHFATIPTKSLPGMHEYQNDIKRTDTNNEPCYTNVISDNPCDQSTAVDVDIEKI